MKKLIRALPTPWTIIITIVVCLLLGLVDQGPHPRALFWLILGAAFLLFILLRNLNPDAYQAHYRPDAYAYRMQRDRLFNRLQALTEAVEATDPAPDQPVALRAAEAREVLNEFTSRSQAH